MSVVSCMGGTKVLRIKLAGYPFCLRTLEATESLSACQLHKHAFALASVKFIYQEVCTVINSWLYIIYVHS